MSKRSKERVSRILANENSNQKLLRGLIKSSKKYRKSLIPLLTQVTEPGSGSKMTKLLKANIQTPKMLTPETALALISTCSLSQDDYQTIRNVAKAHQADIFPSYHKVLKAKKECLPDNIDVEETYADQPLQNLLDHTVTRILNIDTVKDTISGFVEPNLETSELVFDLNLHSKWGFDGSTGQSQYKQCLSNNTAGLDDKSLFSIMLVPLDLSDEKVKY